MKFFLILLMLFTICSIVKSQIVVLNDWEYKITSVSNRPKLTFSSGYNLLFSSSQVNIIINCINKGKKWAEINKTRNLYFGKSLGEFVYKGEKVHIGFLSSGADYWWLSIVVSNAQGTTLGCLRQSNDEAFNKIKVNKFLEELNNANISERLKDIDRIFK